MIQFNTFDKPYDPIHIISIQSNQKIARVKPLHHFESNNLFYENQYGFREKKDTSLAISKLMENLYQSFNDSEIKQGVFYGFQ